MIWTHTDVLRDPGLNAQSMGGLDALSQALKARIDQQTAPAMAGMEQPPGQNAPPMMAGQPPGAYPDIIRALLAGGR